MGLDCLTFQFRITVIDTFPREVNVEVFGLID